MLVEKRGVLFILVILLLSDFVSAITGDFDNDTCVNLDDFFLFAEHFDQKVNENNIKFDLDKNNKIDVEDFFLFAEEFGRCDKDLVSAELRIATLKKKYILGEHIRLTDPPRINEQDGSIRYQPEKESPEEERTLTPETNGYIFQFKEEAILEKKIKLEKKVEENKQKIAEMHKYNPYRSLAKIAYLSEEDIPDELSEHERDIEKIHEKFKEDVAKEIKKSLSKGTGYAIKNKEKEVEVLGEYSNVFNGIALDVSEEEADKIKALRYVKDAHSNDRIKANLMDSVPLINAVDVWKLKDDTNRDLTGKGITIAIIDTGVDYTHPDLGGCTQSQFLSGNCGKVVGGYDFYNDDNDPMDDKGHGTHVASTAAGNGVLKGVAPDAKIYAYKISDSEGVGWENNLLLAIDMVVDPNQDKNFEDHLDIISLSWGGEAGDDPTNNPSRISVDNAIDAGIVVITAAGNEWSGANSKTIICPACSKKAITVGASDKNDKVADFSAKGPNLVDYVIKPEIVAPGSQICAALWDNAYGGSDNCNKDDNHVSIRGTSMATPHVSGAAALLLQKYQNWTPDQIKSALVGTAKSAPPRPKDEPPQKHKICNDTDGGINPTVKGIVLIDGKKYSNYDDDYCINDKLLVEEYCNDNHAFQTIQIDCSEYGGKCFGGVCIDNTTALPFTSIVLKPPEIKVPKPYEKYDVYTQGAGRIDVLKAVNPSILINPSLLNLGLALEDTISLSYSFNIKNIEDKKYGIKLIPETLKNIQTGQSFDPLIIFSKNNFCLEPNSDKNIDLNLDISSLDKGFYSGHYQAELYSDCNFTDHLKSNVLPIGFSKLNKLEFRFIDDPSADYHYHSWQFRLKDGTLKDYTLKEKTSNDLSEYDVYTPYGEFDLLVYVMESEKDKLGVRIFLKHINTSVDKEIIFDINKAKEIKSNLKGLLNSKNMEVVTLEVSLLSDTPNIGFWEEIYTLDLNKHKDWEVKFQSDDDLIFSDYNIITTIVARLKGYAFEKTPEIMAIPIINHYPFIREDIIDPSDIREINIKIGRPFIEDHDNLYGLGITSYSESLDDRTGLMVYNVNPSRTINFYFRKDCISCKYHFWAEVEDNEDYNPTIFKQYWNGPEENYWPGNDKLTDLTFFEGPFKLDLSTKYCVPNRQGMCNDGLVRGILHDNFTTQAYAMTEPTLGTINIVLPDGNKETISQNKASRWYSTRGSWLLNCNSPRYSYPDIFEDISKFCQQGNYQIDWTIPNLVKDRILHLEAAVNYDGKKWTILEINNEDLPQSKIFNKDNFTIKGYLYIGIEKENGNKWQYYKTVIDEKNSRTINPNDKLALDKIFNEINYTVTEVGMYKIVAEFRDKNGKVMQARPKYLRDSYEFKVNK